MGRPAIDGPEHGPRVVLLHGSGGSGLRSWRCQLPLARRWQLIRPTRRGWDPADPPPESWAEMADDVVALLEHAGPTHMVGFSYGGLVALATAARRPALVSSLTILDSPVLGVAPDDPAVAELVRRLSLLYGWARAGRVGPGQFFDLFESAHGLGPAGWTDDPEIRDLPLDAGSEDLARRWIAEREPWLFRPDLAALAGIPALVVTGGFHPAIDAAGSRLAAGLSAEHIVLPVGRHNITLVPDQLNPLLEGRWTTADGQAGPVESEGRATRGPGTPER